MCEFLGVVTADLTTGALKTSPNVVLEAILGLIPS